MSCELCVDLYDHLEQKKQGGAKRLMGNTVTLDLYLHCPPHMSCPWHRGDTENDPAIHTTLDTSVNPPIVHPIMNAQGNPRGIEFMRFFMLTPGG